MKLEGLKRNLSVLKIPYVSEVRKAVIPCFMWGFLAVLMHFKSVSLKQHCLLIFKYLPQTDKLKVFLMLIQYDFMNSAVMLT